MIKLSADIPHKTEANGVVLNVNSASQASASFSSITSGAYDYLPSARIDGVEMQGMVRDGVEVILGITTNEQLGPMLSFGLGGLFTELFRDVSQCPTPNSRAETRQMLGELRGRPLLDGYRGRPEAYKGALIEEMLGLSEFAATYREFEPQLDINPVIVPDVGEGAIAVDCLGYFGEPK